MTDANLQLEGLYLVVAALNNSLVAKGLMSREDIDDALRVAEETAIGDPNLEQLTENNRYAVAFPARLLRLANNGASDGQIQPFSELAKLVGTTQDEVARDMSEPRGEDEVDPSEIVFYTSENGDKWVVVTDVGGRKYVRRIPNHRSGGQPSLTDLDSFRQRDPNSPQNERLEEWLSKHSQSSIKASFSG